MNYRNNIAAGLIGLAALASVNLAFAQSRAVRANEIILDDGAGRTLTLQTPAPLPGAVGSNVNWTLPVPPAGNPPSGFVNAGGAAGQTLYWNSTNLDWEASSVITTNTNNNGSNVTITAPLQISTLSAAAGKLTTDNSGNITKINNVTTSFPAAQGASGSVLTNDGAGNFSWAVAGANSAAVVSTNSTYTGGGSIGSNQNDLAISSTGTYFKVNSTANVNITGINATGSADGRVIYVSNVGVTGFTVTFNNLNAGSTTNDQFTLPSGFDVTISDNSTAVFIYDITAHKWRLVSSN